MKRILLALSLLLCSLPAHAQTEAFGVYIGGLPAAGSVAGGDKLYVLQGGVSKSVSPSLIGGVPGGSSGNIQFNNGGVFGGLTDVQVTSRIQLFSNTLSGAVPGSGGGSTNFLRADGTWAAPPGGGGNPCTTTAGALQYNNGGAFGCVGIYTAASHIIQLDAADAAAPNAQTLQVQSVSTGTSNTSGANWTLQASLGTGTGTSGNIIFATAPAGGSGTTQNAASKTIVITPSGAIANSTTSAGSNSALVPFADSFSTGSWAAQNTSGGPGGLHALGISVGQGATNSSAVFWYMNGNASNLTGGSSVKLAWSNNSSGSLSTINSTGDTFIGRGGAAATLQQGNNDSATAVAQTTQVQSVVAGTTNTAGTDWTFQGSRGTGTGAGGNILFNLAPDGTTGTSQNAAVQVFKISPAANNGTTAARPAIQVGSSNTTSQGWIIGYGGFSNASGMWGTDVTPSTTNYTLLSSGGNAVLNGAGQARIRTGGNDGILVTNTNITFYSTSGTISDIIGIPANGDWQFGGFDAASPGAQTVSAQSVVAGTSNTAGVDWTFIGSKGTGTGAGGNIIFDITPAGTTGTSQNSTSEIFRMSSIGGATDGRHVRIGNMASVGAITSLLYTNLGANTYQDGTNYFAITTGKSGTLVLRNDGSQGLYYYVAPSVSAGATTSPAEQFSYQTSSSTLSLVLGSRYSIGGDVFWSRSAAAIWQQGAADAAAPVAQTIQVQSVVAGTSNTSGAAWNFIGSKGTGTGTGGIIAWQTSIAGTTGTSQNAAAERMRIDINGNINIAGAINNGIFDGTTPIVEVDSPNPSVNWTYAGRAYSNDTFSASWVFSKTRGTSGPNAHTAVAANDRLGVMDFYGDDGSAFNWAAEMVVEVDGTVSAGVVPSRIRFLTNPGGGNTEHVRINSKGHVNFTTVAPTASACAGFALGTGSSDTSGSVTFTSATSCAISFSAAFTNAPFCMIMPGSAASTVQVTTSTTVLTATFGTAQTSMQYHCFGN